MSRPLRYKTPEMKTFLYRNLELFDADDWGSKQDLNNLFIEYCDENRITDYDHKHQEMRQMLGIDCNYYSDNNVVDIKRKRANENGWYCACGKQELKNLNIVTFRDTNYSILVGSKCIEKYHMHKNKSTKRSRVRICYRLTRIFAAQLSRLQISRNSWMFGA